MFNDKLTITALFMFVNTYLSKNIKKFYFIVKYPNKRKRLEKVATTEIARKTAIFSFLHIMTILILYYNSINKGLRLIFFIKEVTLVNSGAKPRMARSTEVSPTVYIIVEFYRRRICQ